MWTGNGIGKKTHPRGSVPFKNNALFIINGTIVENGGSYYFKDQTGNNRDFLITDKDFTNSYFPYKSAATISAPKGDAELMAADVNNFLYDSAGEPNQIPAVSLFQDIDYEHIAFTRHSAQVVDINGVEIKEPYIKEFVWYDSVLGGSSLLTALIYYSVTSENVFAYWIDPDGNDTTGDGSKSNPWLTVDKAVDTVNDGSLIYVKTNEYPGHSTLEYIYDAKINQLQGIGFATSKSPDLEYGLRLRDSGVTLFEGFFIQPIAAASYGLYFQDTTALHINKIYLNNFENVGLYGNILSIKNSVLKGTMTEGISVLPGLSPPTIESCLIKNSSVIGIYIRTAMTILNNLIKTLNGYSIYCVDDVNSVIIKGNVFSPIKSNYIIYMVGSNYPLSIIYNTFNLDEGAATFIRLESFINNVPIISDNIINSTILSGQYIIYALNSTLKAERNIINHSNQETGYGGIRIAINAADVYSEATINNNRIISDLKSAYCIGIGYETTNLGDNDIALISIKNNYIEGADINGSGVTQSTHALFVGFQINAKIMYNCVIGSSYGVVIKGSSDTIYTTGGFNYNLLIENNKAILLKGTHGVTVTNNTVINKNILSEYGVSLAYNTGDDDAANNTIKNNIFIFLGTGTNIGIKKDAGINNDINYNIYYSPNGDLRFNNNGVLRTFAEWQSDGYDVNSIILTDLQFNVLFKDYDNGDYSLASGSVAIGAGANLGVNYDMGLDSTTDWGDESAVPVVKTKQQAGNWNVGAYIN